MEHPEETIASLDTEADLERLLTTVGPQIRAVLADRFRGVFQRSDADDILAIALSRIWNHRKRFDAKRGSVRAWFFRIAHNAALDVLKHGWHKARLLEVDIGDGLVDSFPAAASTSGEPADSHERRPDVLALLRQLPEIQQRILWADALNPGGRLPAAALAREFGVTPGAIRVYRKRALDRLRRELAERASAIADPHSSTPALHEIA